MLTKSKARGASRKAGSIYVEVEYAPGRSAWVQIIKSDLWRALKEYPNDGEISGTIDANGDVWIGPSQSESGTRGYAAAPASASEGMQAIFNRLDQIEKMVRSNGEELREDPPKRRPSRLMGRGPVSERGPVKEED